MKTRHRIKISARCPVNGDADLYEATVYPVGLLYCERIVEAVAKLDPVANPITQEALTQKLADALMCKVKTVGTHCQRRVTTTIVCLPSIKPQ